MKTKLMTAVGCGALILMVGACEGRAEYRARKAEREALKVVSKLDCPETQGNLKRTAAAADGLSCDYAGDGTEVTLRLVAVSAAAENILRITGILEILKDPSS